VRPILLSALLAAALAAPAAAQQSTPSSFPAVGTMAPDIEVRGATRYGALDAPVRLSQFRGETVVLAFFFRVRGGG